MSEKGTQMETQMLPNTAIMLALGSIGEHSGAFGSIGGRGVAGGVFKNQSFLFLGFAAGLEEESPDFNRNQASPVG